VNLTLIGHDYQYAVEQILVALFPEDADSLTVVSRISRGEVYAHAMTYITKDKATFRGIHRIRLDALTDKLETNRLLQRAVKLSFYHAAMLILQSPPVWGALTGIRPGRIAANAIEAGQDPVRVLTQEYFVAQDRAELCTDTTRRRLALAKTVKPRDVALYIGIPFCPTRCAYCSFVSNSVEKSFRLIEPFVEALLREITDMAALTREFGLRPVTVYIGGGTPTALTAEHLGEILHRIRDCFDLTGVREYTVEAGRADTITPEKLLAMRENGVTRVSVNPQSMSQTVLNAIGRSHTPEDVLAAVRCVREVGGLSLNMDIIAGLPEDTPAGFRNTVDTVLGLVPENVTVHTLAMKKGSALMVGGGAVPNGKSVADMLMYSTSRLQESGYLPYYLYRQKFTSGGFENTGWSLPGQDGIYNIWMMEEIGTVLAMGGGGVTRLMPPGENPRFERIFNVKYPLEYIERQENFKAKLARIKEFYTCHLS